MLSINRRSDPLVSLKQFNEVTDICIAEFACYMGHAAVRLAQHVFRQFDLPTIYKTNEAAYKLK